MSVKDEFYSLPPEEAPSPKEAAERRSEENLYGTKNQAKLAKVNEENRVKQKRNSLKKMVAGALVSVSVITSVAGDDIFFRTNAKDLPISSYEMYTRMDSGLVDYDSKTAYLTDGYTAHSVGVLVSKEPIDLSEAITLEFDVLQVGYGEFANGNGADGISVGFSRYENARGLDGGCLGYDSEFGVELDLCKNQAEDTPGGADYDNDHISILGNYVWDAIAVTEPMELDDGTWHHITIEYRDSVLYVKYDNQQVLQGKIANNYKKLYLKIAGATGDDLCYQAVSNIRINDEVLLIDDKYATDKNDYIQITDFSGDKSKTETLILDNETADDEPENEPTQQNDISNINTDPGKTNSDDNHVPVEKDCPACNGTGIICPGSAAADDPEGCHGAVIVDCKACNGTGHEANGKLCNWCKGTLKHMCPSFESHYECPDCGGTGRIIE